ncbi:MAG TPA: hypothetical protein VHQ86_04520 [Candidatus Saccharimonadia bacterium]|jgi:hypothetical protein|nr:hypothetical protein [Candidatus Saccharimonadia bacterium]
MSTIGRFLQAKEPLFDHALHQLELKSHQRGVDVKLAAEIAQTAAKRTKTLGLTPDCTGPELYDALIALVAQHDEHLARAIGGTDPTNLSEMIPLIVKAAENAPLPKDGWFLKEERAKDMLRHMPPLAIMDRLGHHLVSRLLEEENIYELFLALRFVESPEFLNDFDRQYLDLTPDDFEPRRIRVVPFAASKWGDVAEHFIQKKRHNITHSKEMGAIAIMPMRETHMTGITLKVMPLLFHYFNEIRLYSSFFKLMRTKQNFGAIISDTLIADPAHVKIADNAHIHWRVIQRYFGKLTTEVHPEIFEPHVQPEDLHWRRAEEVLYDIDPELEFWKNLDFVAVLKGDTHDTITFNLMDISLSYSNGIAYADRYLYHFREALWNEVFARYLGEKVLEEQLLDKLDNAVIKPEVLSRNA